MHRVLALAVVGVLTGTVGELRATSGMNGGCARTPAAALLAARDGVVEATGTSGFRVDVVRWDPLLRQNWAVIKSCDHPEQTPVTMVTDMIAPHRPGHFTASAIRSYAVMPIVRAGDLVRLWRNDRFAHIEIIGTSEENAAAGSRVRIRLPASRDQEGQIGPPQYRAGIVRGPADVEMEMEVER